MSDLTISTPDSPSPMFIYPLFCDVWDRICHLRDQENKAKDKLREIFDKTYVRRARDYDEVVLSEFFNPLNANGFDKFFDEYITVVAELTKEDLRSISDLVPSDRCQAYCQFIRTLGDVYRIPTNRGKAILWTGAIAKRTANRLDGVVPFVGRPHLQTINILNTTMFENDPAFANLLNVVVSAIYAEDAEGDTDVYLSSEKNGFIKVLEGSSIVVGSHFWDGELPKVRQKQEEGLANRIFIVRHKPQELRQKGATAAWKDRVDLDDEENQKVLTVVRRQAYQIGHRKLDDEYPQRFAPAIHNQAHYETFKASGSRPRLTIAKMKAFIRIWKLEARRRHSGKFQASAADLSALKDASASPMPLDAPGKRVDGSGKKNLCERSLSVLSEGYVKEMENLKVEATSADFEAIVLAAPETDSQDLSSDIAPSSPESGFSWATPLQQPKVRCPRVERCTTKQRPS